ncbi:hypothetical protein D593_1131 [Streptococcus intermedius BA1]|nr:hypothetical protein D593_1131 [Streptococcus intermedius BA1]
MVQVNDAVLASSKVCFEVARGNLRNKSQDELLFELRNFRRMG